MNTQRIAARRIEEEVSPPRVEKDPPLEEGVSVKQVPANPSPMIDADIRDAFLQMAQDITCQDQATTLQA